MCDQVVIEDVMRKVIPITAGASRDSVCRYPKDQRYSLEIFGHQFL